MRLLNLLPLLLLFVPISVSATVYKQAGIDQIARNYVELSFSVYLLNGGSDKVETPRRDELEKAKAAKRNRSQITAEAADLLQDLDLLTVPQDRLSQMRHRALRARIVSLHHDGRAEGAAKTSVDEEVRLRFGFTPRFPPLASYDPALRDLDAAMAGPGTLAERINALRKTAAVSPQNIEPVFRAAMAECRRRTGLNIELADETVDVRFVKDELTPAQADYARHGKSIISISTVIPTDVDRLLQHACHEVYPGHHVHMVTMDRALYQGRGWPEFGAAMGADPLIPAAEAIAEYGVGLAFPIEERIAFQRDVLFPLAGLRMDNEAQWKAYLSARSHMLGSSATIARDYLAGKLDDEAATALLVRYRLQTPEAAQQTVKMIKAFGSYLIASDLGWFAVDRALRDKPRDQQWQLLKQLQQEPMLLDDIDTLGAARS